MKSISYLNAKGVYEEGSSGQAEILAMELRLALNLAQGRLKLRLWGGAEESARKALELDPDNTKGKSAAKHSHGVGECKTHDFIRQGYTNH